MTPAEVLERVFTSGMMARSLRQRDHDEQQIVFVRRLDGSTRPH